MRLTELASETAALAAGTAMAGLAAARRGKAVHPQGEVFRARLDVPGTGPAGSTLLSTPGEHDAVVRFSRSLGVPRPLPDLLGLALRVLDAYGPDRHQDLLLVTSVDRPVLHHVFVPSRGIADHPYSSSLPYVAGEERFVIGALPRSEATFDLAVAPPGGTFAPVATLAVGEKLAEVADALRFNPFNTGGGLEPSGWLNDLRRRAYPMSQATWGRVRPHADDHQRTADRITEAVRR